MTCRISVGRSGSAYGSGVNGAPSSASGPGSLFALAASADANVTLANGPTKLLAGSLFGAALGAVATVGVDGIVGIPATGFDATAEGAARRSCAVVSEGPRRWPRRAQ
jgi:hypothetical protein